jgi:DNA polymerase I-like protein with 3'-5' exonuclease and polymerase domains
MWQMDTEEDVLKKVLYLLPEALKGIDAKIVSCVHDEIILEAVVDAAEKFPTFFLRL